MLHDSPDLARIISVMLTTLRIKNLALVPDLTLELKPGYNVVTGETGAGKSILIGALNLVLGERADRTLIRSGEESCSVEAVFEVATLRAPLKMFLEENGLEPCEDNQLMLKRSFTSSGANRQFINGSPTTLNVLSALGAWLVDIHGPHDHQSLLHVARQLAILDAFSKLEPQRDAFAEQLRLRTTLAAEKAALIVDEKAYAQQLDLLRFQVNEIASARLDLGEEAQLGQDFQRASNAAKLLQLSRTALGLLNEEENSLAAQAGILGRTLQELQRVDAGGQPLLVLHDELIARLRELTMELSRYSERLELDPRRLQELEERLNLIHSLKRKYGSTLSEVMAFGEEAARKLSNLEQRDAELNRIQAELQTVETELWRSGQLLSERRRKVAPKLCKAVTKELSDLGFKQSQFDIAISTPDQATRDTHHLSASGLDTIEFLFAPNPGEPAKPLRAIASSGEIARVMLALKTVLASEDDIPVLIFDEVDANVGGETAAVVGEKMQQIARQHQVICITHLAPVAAPASAHYVATKRVETGRTISEISLLDLEERVTELARMLGSQTAIARKHAAALLKTRP